MVNISEAQKGKPFCTKAKRYVGGRIMPQCEACNNLVYIGCPGFERGKIALAKVVDYIKWFIGDLFE